MTAPQKITPCLWFESQAMEAAQFYVSVLGGSIDQVMRASTDTPGTRQGDVLLVSFTLAGQSYQALNGGKHEAFNDSVSLSVRCEDQAEVDRLWAALTADGGRPVQCGWLKDRWGLAWQIVPRQLPELLASPDEAKVRRVMLAMMEMQKIVVAELQAAADAA
ncbi:MAG: VOC family protein [Hyphomicrobiaceae bacterium]|nr:VOC family protein [Hyphomicrobiaceae bacterium]